MATDIYPQHKLKSAVLAAGVLAVASLIVIMVLPPSTNSLLRDYIGMLSLHLLMELFAVIIAMLVVNASWHAFDQSKTHTAKVLMCGFSIVAVCDVMHALTYAGMPFFLAESSTQRAIFFWLMGRTFEVGTMALVAANWVMPLSRKFYLGVGLATSGLIVWSGSYNIDVFPVLFVEGFGVTELKVVYEYALCFLNIIVAYMFWQRANNTGESRFYLLALSSFVMGIGEISFTAYVTPSDFQNIFGHIFKIAAYLLLYRATFVFSLNAPYEKIRQSESKLRDSEERFRTLAIATSQIVWTTNAQGKVTEDIPSWRMYTGQNEDDIKGQGWSDALHPDDAKHALAVWMQAVEQKLHYKVEFRIRRHDGAYRNFWVRGVPVHEKDGRIREWVGTCTDITERKQTEAALLASEKHLQEITDLMPVALFVKDAASRFLMMNQACEAQFGLSFTELRGTDGGQFFPPEQMVPFLAKDAEVFATSKLLEIDELVWNATLKENRNVHTLKKPVYDETGAPSYLICMTIDTTEHTQMLESLRLSSLVLENSSEGMLVTNEKNMIIAVNPAFTTITGYTFEEVQGQNPRILSSGRQDKAFYQAMWQELESTGHWQGEIWDKRKNGEIHAKWLTINTIRTHDGGVHRYVALFSDITEKKQSEELIWRQANFDTLTGLPNRRMFHERLKQEIMLSDRSRLPLALLLLDLDQFKEVNDTLGHDMGDMLLKQAARRIAECVRDTDAVARLGGDEFTVLLPQLADIHHAEDIAQKILNRLAKPFHLGKDAAFVSASIGITLYPNDAASIESMMKNADQAMYVAKNQGRNRFSYFTPALQEAAQKRLRMTNELRGALAANQFEVYFQPIVELATGNIYKAEALIRWHHPERGMVSPAEFIPLAEETGLIVEIGDWVFKESIRWVNLWRTQFAEDFKDSTIKSAIKFFENFQISVNVSPVQFKAENRVLAEEWQHHLQEYGLSGRSIVIEITEGLLLHGESDILNKLLKLRDAGFQVAIDDFGTGYSSLSYLKKFDIDYLKIDQSFVRNIETDPDNMALSRAIVVMAHTLGLKVIAEGVETEGQRKLLADAGCDYAQGYLFSRPVPPKEFEALLKQRLSVS